MANEKESLKSKYFDTVDRATDKENQARSTANLLSATNTQLGEIERIYSRKKMLVDQEIDVTKYLTKD